MVAVVLGGVGLFLLGMLLMTDGLKTAAGAALNRILARFTNVPITGVFSGALATVLVQSSSATTLATIGFVSAGMITFPQALGVIYGINLGATSTAWLVAVIGFRVDVASVALPLVAVGAFVRLLAWGRTAAYGLVLAGLGLLFLGINTLQGGMAGFAASFDVDRFALDGLWGVILLVAVGAAMTVVLQASGVAVAATLAALHVGAISLEHAAALVIGQNVGTTVKAAVATIGASLAARRAALAHILFNVFTAAAGIALLGWFVLGMLWLQSNLLWEPATALAAFHTAFNVLGVALFLPFTRPFARLVERLVPGRGPEPTRHLNPRLIPTASAAIDAARRAALDVAALVFDMAGGVLRGRIGMRGRMALLDRADEGLKETRVFLGRVRSEAEGSAEYRRHVSVLHAIDHLDRLVEACREEGHEKYLGRDGGVRDACQGLAAQLFEARALIHVEAEEDALGLIEAVTQEVMETRRKHRVEVLESAAAGSVDFELALSELEATRWVDRIAYHSWRALLHLQVEPPPDQSGETVM